MPTPQLTIINFRHTTKVRDGKSSNEKIRWNGLISERRRDAGRAPIADERVRRTQTEAWVPFIEKTRGGISHLSIDRFIIKLSIKNKWRTGITEIRGKILINHQQYNKAKISKYNAKKFLALDLPANGENNCRMSSRNAQINPESREIRKNYA